MELLGNGRIIIILHEKPVIIIMKNDTKGYLQDSKRYSAGRGAHINLKRAEKARILVRKIPSKFQHGCCKIMYIFHLLQFISQKCLRYGGQPDKPNLCLGKRKK